MALNTPNTPRDFYDLAPLGVCIVRRDRRAHLEILYSNAIFDRQISRDGEARKVEGMRLDTVWPSREVIRLVRKLRAATPPRSFSLPVGDEQGLKDRWITLTVAPGDFEGEACFVLWATDISADKQSESKLREELKAADAVAEMKSNFLATMSHEIRTPMQAIYGLLELIAEEKPEDKIMAMTSIALDAASGLLEILDDVLDFAKIDADRMELDMFEVPVRTLAAGVLEAMSVKVRGRDVKLTMEVDDAVPPVIVGDPKRLRQIVINLMGNALKFTERGAVTLRIGTTCRTLHSDHGVDLRFEIADTGIGIPPDVAKRLFTPFTQADSSTSRRFGGTGLGLSISKKLVHHMGGEIGVDSVVGQGSTFWFEIPTESIGTQDTTAQLPSLDGITVLSIEDHPQAAREIKRSLESMGASVETCGNAADAMQLARRRPFDVVLVDQGLPDMLGADLIDEIMRVRPFLGFVMYTARDDAGLQQSLTAKGVRFLPKPAGRLGLGEAVKDAARKFKSAELTGLPTRLLIAEDTASVRDVLQRQLAKLGVEADFVQNGAEALAALETGRYGIVFTDMHMPQMDGYAVIAGIRQTIDNRPDGIAHMPTVALTADVQMAQRHTYLELGFDECLLKPVSLGQLKRLLIRWGLVNEQSAPEPVAAAGDMAEASLDLDAMRQQMGALDDGTVEMMRQFVGMTAPILDRMMEAQGMKDRSPLLEVAHSLKGAARSACCPVLGDLAARLQEDAEDTGQSATIVAGILTEFENVKRAVAQLRPD